MATCLAVAGLTFGRSPFLCTLGHIGAVACFAVGPGIVVWLALTELMPTRIRSVGMSAALPLNQGISMLVAGSFLPAVERWGHATVFLAFAIIALIYSLVALLLVPETKGRSLEEIERLFASVGDDGRPPPTGSESR